MLYVYLSKAYSFTPLSSHTYIQIFDRMEILTHKLRYIYIYG